MKKATILRNIVIAFLACSSILAISAYDDSVWDNAREAYRRGTLLKPYSMTMYMEELDPSGKTVSYSKYVYSLSYPNGPDKPESTLQYAEKDGKDITEETRSKKPGSGGFGGDFENLLPFEEKVEKNVTKSTPFTEIVSGVKFNAVPYIAKGQKSAAKGTVYFSLDGKLTFIKSTPDPIPFPMSRFDYDTYFTYDSEGRALVSSVQFYASGTFFFVQKTVRGSMKFTGYR